MSTNTVIPRSPVFRRPTRAVTTGGQDDLFGHAPAAPRPGAPAPAPSVRRGFGGMAARTTDQPSPDAGGAPGPEAQRQDPVPAQAGAGKGLFGRMSTGMSDAPPPSIEEAPPVPAQAGPEESSSTELKGKVKKIIFARDDFRVYLLKVRGRDDVSVTVTSPFHATVDAQVTVRGEWGTFRGKPTFKAKLIIQDVPKDTKGIVAWIKTGAVPGVGKATGEALVKHYGDRILEVIENPEALAEGLLAVSKGYSAAQAMNKATAIATAWKTNAMQPELIAYLGSLGLGESLMTKIIRRYGMTAKRLIETNPWQLAETIDGLGFHTADDIARKSGHATDSVDRIRAGIRYALNEAIGRDGHCGLPVKEMVARAQKILALERPMIEKEVWEVLDGQKYVYDEDTELATARIVREAEQAIADDLLRLLGSDAIPEDRAAEAIDAAQEQLGIKLDPSQRDAALLALTNSVCIITGGPGTGKSTTQKVIVQALKSFEREIVLGAPTGRAAKRLSEVSGLDASTCHRLLQFNAEIGGFSYNSENQFEEDWFILDEFSMVDTRLAYSFIQAIASGSGFTIVGDVDQLPSVGAGQVLRDLIDCGVIPTARLTTIHRQGKDSGIVVAAHRINGGLHPQPDDDEVLDGFQVEPREGPANVVARTVELMQTTLPAMGFDPLRDIQVLAAQRRGDIGTPVLNEAIKAAMNPQKDDGNSVEIKFKTWTVGDRVMHIRNDYAKGVYNGEVGFVVRTGQRLNQDSGRQEPYFTVDYSGYEASYTHADVDDVEQSWAATIHKSQGCEFPVVVLVCPYEHKFMLSRNLLYTGVTRSKQLCIVVGDHTAIQVAVDNVSMTRRYTGLARYLTLAAMRLSAEPPEPEALPPPVPGE